MEQRVQSGGTRPTYMIFGKDVSISAKADALKEESWRRQAALALLSDKPTAVVAGVGELDICTLCHSSPHVVGCPEHSDFEDDRVSYFLAGAPEEVGPASYWVNDTFAAAASEAGLDDRAALAEGIQEFKAALKREELKPTRLP